MRVENHGSHADQDPRPGAQRVVGHVEPQGGEQRVALVFRAEHTLRDVAAAARLRARVPRGPPVDGNVNEERDGGHPDRRDVGDKAEERAARTAQFRLHGFHAADRVHGGHGQHDHHGHLDEELEKVGDEHAPETGKAGDERREGDDADHHPERLTLGDAEHQPENLDHRQVDPPEDDAIHQHAQIDGAEAAQEGGRFAGVAQLGELDIGGDARAPP